MDGGVDNRGFDGVRISTADREETSRLLAEHFAEGRLTIGEYEERASRALEARTRQDIRVLFTDLPMPHPHFLLPAPVAPVVGQAAVQPLQLSDRSAIAAGVLQIVVPIGVGRFYTGHTKLAVLQLLATLITFGAAALWPLIDGILLLIHGGTDARGRPLR